MNYFIAIYMSEHLPKGIEKRMIHIWMCVVKAIQLTLKIIHKGR